MQLQAQLDHHRRKVDTDRFDLTVREIVRMATEGELHRAPEYQRKFRWDRTRESQLIESLLLGLPVPNVFVATNKDATWELVDGLQRVTTLMHFVGTTQALQLIGKSESLVLEGLEKLTEFNGMSFSDLPTAIQLHLQKRSMPVIALSDKSDLIVRFDLFERLNRGGVVLEPQEVRACIFRGDFNGLLRELADDPRFKSLLKLRKAQLDDGTREELVLKFFAYLHDRDSFRGAVTTFLNDYMEAAAAEFDLDEGRDLFKKVVSDLAGGMHGPVLRSNTRVTPLNQLEAILVGAAEVVLNGGKIRVPAGRQWLDDPELVKHSTKGTNTPAALRGRVARARELLSGTAQKRHRTKS